VDDLGRLAKALWPATLNARGSEILHLARHRRLDALAGAEDVDRLLWQAGRGRRSSEALTTHLLTRVKREPQICINSEDGFEGLVGNALHPRREPHHSDHREEIMAVGPDAAKKAAVLTKLSDRQIAGARRHQSCVTRRQFTRAATGTALYGGALGAGCLKPALASNWSFAPVPIPGGSPNLGGFYHVFGPASMGLGDPIDAEPITITNLDGFVGIAYISGMVTRTNTKTGERLRLPYRDSDMRFMQGNFRGTDGNIHQSTFALV
jgi:hypothetical protein